LNAVLVLTRSDVKSLVSMSVAIELMKVAFGELARGAAQSPLRTPLTVGDAVSLIMPAYVPSAHALGLKVVSVFPQNQRRTLPTISSLVTLLDDTTGQPIAIMDGGYLTALRTGAVSGAATDLLARRDSTVLTVIGAGAQAVTQLAAVCAVRPIERAMVVVRSEESGSRFRTALRNDWPDLHDLVEVTDDGPRAVQAAHVVCTATSSREPVFRDQDIQPGTHINGVGSFTPEMQEVPTATVRRATIVVDQLEPALEEAGDLIVPLHSGDIGPEHVTRELGHLVNGDASGRVTDEEVTFFKSVGNAVQDMVVARSAFDAAMASQVGQHVELI
jgi:ornithine cyclodeaminase